MAFISQSSSAGFGASSHEVQMLLNADVSALHAAWRSEAQSPEILPFRARLVSDISSLLSEQQVSIARFKLEILRIALSL